MLTDADSDIGLIAYEMAMLVERMGKYLATDAAVSRPGMPG